jgi:hypothetical protein
MLPNGNVWKSTNGGIDWSVKSNGLPPSVNVNSLTLDMSVNPAIVYAATVQGVYKTTNGGDVWFPINNGLTYTQVTYVYQNPKNPGFVYVVTKAENNQGHIFKTENGGESWTEINSGIPQTSLFKLSMDIKNPARLYVGTYGGGLYSSDAPPSQPQNLNIYNGVGSISMGSKFRVGFCLI